MAPLPARSINTQSKGLSLATRSRVPPQFQWNSPVTAGISTSFFSPAFTFTSPPLPPHLSPREGDHVVLLPYHDKRRSDEEADTNFKKRNAPTAPPAITSTRWMLLAPTRLGVTATSVDGLVQRLECLEWADKRFRCMTA